MKHKLAHAVAQLALPLALVSSAFAADVESTVLQFGNEKGVGTTPAGGVSVAAIESDRVLVDGFLQAGGQGFGGVFTFNIVTAQPQVTFTSMTTTPVSGEEPDVVSIGPPITDGPNTISLGYITLSTGLVPTTTVISSVYTPMPETPTAINRRALLCLWAGVRVSSPQRCMAVQDTVHS